jgi:hypothetical protein
MPDVTVTRLRGHLYEVPLDATPDQVEVLGLDVMSQVAAANHYDIVGGTIQVEVDEPSVYADDGLGAAGWFPTSDPDIGHRYGKPTHRTIVWVAHATPSPESIAVQGVREYDGAVTVTVPELIRMRGGFVRAVHNLGQPVNVTAMRANGEQLGYLLATEIDANEVEVQVVPETTTLHVTPAQ